MGRRLINYVAPFVIAAGLSMNSGCYYMIKSVEDAHHTKNTKYDYALQRENINARYKQDLSHKIKKSDKNSFSGEKKDKDMKALGTFFDFLIFLGNF